MQILYFDALRQKKPERSGLDAKLATTFYKSPKS